MGKHYCKICNHVVDEVEYSEWAESETEKDGCPYCYNAASALKTSFLEDEPLPHLSGGWSGDVGCSLKKIYSYLHPKPFDGQGAVAPGTTGHEHEQKRLPTGIILSNKYEICSHEQLVRIDDETPKGRRSPIDTLVFNLITQQYESWDYKFVRTDMRYQLNPNPKYVLQSNLFAYGLKLNFSLPYDPMFRIIYCEKINYANKKEFCFKLDEELALETIKRLNRVKKVVNKYKSIGNLDEMNHRYARLLANGLDMWYETKTQRYRSECRYCGYSDKCAKKIGFDCTNIKKWETKKLVFNDTKSVLKP